MKRGRSKILIEKRNKKLIERYFFLTEVARNRFDDTIKTLSEDEFFISETCVLNILRNNHKYYSELMANNKTKIRKT